MSQFSVPTKNPPWIRGAAIVPPTCMSQHAPQVNTVSFMGQQANLPAAPTVSTNPVFAQAVVAAHQHQQHAAAAVGLTAIRITQPGIAIPTSLTTQPTQPARNPPGLALPTTMSTSHVATVSYPAPTVIQPHQFQHAPLQNVIVQQQQQQAVVVAQVAQMQQHQIHHQQQQQHANLSANQQTSVSKSQQQRVFTGTVTKLHDNFGFVDEDVFFQVSCIKGVIPKTHDRVLVEASYNSNTPFKWNATRIQVLPNQNQPNSAAVACQSQQPAQQNLMSTVSSISASLIGTNIVSNTNSQPMHSLSNAEAVTVKVDERQRSQPSTRVSLRSYNQHISSCNQPVALRSVGSSIRNRVHSPPAVGLMTRNEVGRRDDKSRSTYRDGDREIRRSSPTRKRSRSPRNRSHSPARRRTRVATRYSVQVPKASLDVKHGYVVDLKKRYNNMYIPSDFFSSVYTWIDVFPLHRPFKLIHPCAFHIMNKEVDPLSFNDAVLEPPDADYIFSAKVMLLSTPNDSDFYRKTCGISLDEECVQSNSKDSHAHPTRLINFLVGLRGKNETMAIGGPWSPSLDGEKPETDPQVLIKTAIRNCQALCGIDLSVCTTWYRFAEIYYRRSETTHKGRPVPARVETVVIFLPDVWSCAPTRLDWEGLTVNYKKQLYRKQAAKCAAAVSTSTTSAATADHQDSNSQKDNTHVADIQSDATHYSELDPKNMKVTDLRKELEARNLSPKGLKSQLIARLLKAVKSESEREDQIAEEFEAAVSGFSSSQQSDNNEIRTVKKSMQDEECKVKEDREKVARKYHLPENPSIIVHPSRTAKCGKFDCTVMSLSVLLDYRHEDNKEHSFEVSLFAELFNEMLMRDFGFSIYRSLYNAPDVKDEDKEQNEKKEDKKDDEEKIDIVNNRVKEDNEDDMDGEIVKNDDEKSDDKQGEVKLSESLKKCKKTSLSIDYVLLLSFRYFDINLCNYLIDKDVEEILLTIGLQLSRAQVRKLVQKVSEKDFIYYRKLTDHPKVGDERHSKTSGDGPMYMQDNESSGIDDLCQNIDVKNLEDLANGNRSLLPIFRELNVRHNNLEVTDVKPDSESRNEFIMYNGCVLQVSQLLKQLEHSEKCRLTTESKLKEVQEELDDVKEMAHTTKLQHNTATHQLLESEQKVSSTSEKLLKLNDVCNSYKNTLKKLQCQLKICQEDIDTSVESSHEMSSNVDS